jgi:hypothetical protein
MPDPTMYMHDDDLAVFVAIDGDLLDLALVTDEDDRDSAQDAA